MERILVIGSPGTGKSTLSVALSRKLSLPLVHLDQLFWRPGWVQVPRDEFDRLLEAELHRERWIIDGNFSRTLSRRLAFCDTVIYLDFSTFAALTGVIKRVLTTHGKTRPDMGVGCPERFDWNFISTVLHFRKTQRSKLRCKFAETPDITVITLKNRRQIRRFLTGI